MTEKYFSILTSDPDTVITVRPVDWMPTHEEQLRVAKAAMELLPGQKGLKTCSEDFPFTDDTTTFYTLSLRWQKSATAYLFLNATEAEIKSHWGALGVFD